MKREITLKVGSKEEYTFTVSLRTWDNIIFSLLEDSNILTNKEKKEILLNSNDSSLINFALSVLSCNLNYQELESIYNKIEKDLSAQMLMVSYCGKKKKIRFLKMMASKGIDEVIRKEAEYYLEELKK